MGIETSLQMRKRMNLDLRRERVRAMKEETALINADTSIWRHAEIEQAKRDGAALLSDMRRKAAAMQIEPEAEDFK